MSTLTVTLTDAEANYVLGGLIDRHAETLRYIAAEERFLAGGACCDKTRPTHEHRKEMLDAFVLQKNILSSAITKVRAALPPEEATG